MPRGGRDLNEVFDYQSPANLESRSRVTIRAGKSSRTVAVYTRYHEVNATIKYDIAIRINYLLKERTLHAMNSHYL